MKTETCKSVAVIVAHPDDETLWAGGTILSNPNWKYTVICLCGSADRDRALKFHSALKMLNADGKMGDLEDRAEKELVNESAIESMIMKLLPTNQYDLIITHSSSGEYTRHPRHEDVYKAVLKLWQSNEIVASELWTFAYEDGNKSYFPKAIGNATIYNWLPEEIWKLKYHIMTEVYGFEKHSWEAETTPFIEAFWQYKKDEPVIKAVDEQQQESEMKIFKTPNLDMFKSMYYKSIGLVTGKEIWLAGGKRHFTTALWKFKNPNLIKKSLGQFVSELKIFKSPTIDTFKSLYYKSIGCVMVTKSSER